MNAELVDSTTSALGNDEVYRYYIWLDRTGGVIDSTTVPKSYKNSEYLYVASETLCKIAFDFGGRDSRNIRIIIEQEGMLRYTFDAVDETPAMFKPGIYNIYFYENGDFVSSVIGVDITASGQTVSM